MMTNRKRGASEFFWLRKVTAQRRPDLLPLLQSIETGQRRLRQEDREELREVVAAELVETGLDASDNPTQRGLMLERVIDWLGKC